MTQSVAAIEAGPSTGQPNGSRPGAEAAPTPAVEPTRASRVGRLAARVESLNQPLANGESSGRMRALVARGDTSLQAAREGVFARWDSEARDFSRDAFKVGRAVVRLTPALAAGVASYGREYTERGARFVARHTRRGAVALGYRAASAAGTLYRGGRRAASATGRATANTVDRGVARAQRGAERAGRFGERVAGRKASGAAEAANTHADRLRVRQERRAKLAAASMEAINNGDFRAAARYARQARRANRRVNRAQDVAEAYNQAASDRAVIARRRSRFADRHQVAAVQAGRRVAGRRAV